MPSGTSLQNQLKHMGEELDAAASRIGQASQLTAASPPRRQAEEIQKHRDRRLNALARPPGPATLCQERLPRLGAAAKAMTGGAELADGINVALMELLASSKRLNRPGGDYL